MSEAKAIAGDLEARIRRRVDDVLGRRDSPARRRARRSFTWKPVAHEMSWLLFKLDELRSSRALSAPSTPASPPQRHDICPKCGTDLGAITSELLSKLARYGCTQCGNDYDHTPLTVNVPGIPARTYYFCSFECRNTWLGSPVSSPQEKL